MTNEDDYCLVFISLIWTSKDRNSISLIGFNSRYPPTPHNQSNGNTKKEQAKRKQLILACIQYVNSDHIMKQPSENIHKKDKKKLGSNDT